MLFRSNNNSRIGNPTVAAFEERIASLEGGIGAVATASGMSAEFITFSALLGAGDHIVASAQLYGGTVTLLADVGFADDEAVEWMLEVEPSLGTSPIAALRAGRKAEVRRVAQALA